MKTFRTCARRVILPAFFALAFAAPLARPARAQLDQWGYWENGVTESWWLSSDTFAKEDAVNAVALWKTIGAAKTGAAGGEWAGDYFRGSDTHGTYIRWSAEAGFVIASINKCEARVLKIVYGKVDVSPTLVQFFPEFSKTAASPPGHSHRAADSLAAIRFVPVEWRGERLLVAEGELSNFGDFVAGLGEYNFWLSSPYLFYDDYSDAVFFTKRVAAEAREEGVGRQQEGQAEGGGGAKAHDEVQADDEESEEIKPPVVPPGYDHLLKPPVEATITTIGRRRVARNLSFKSKHAETFYEHASLTSVTIDAGTERGVKAGMFLLVREPDEGDRLRVVRAGKHSSTGYVIRELKDDGRETFTDGDSERPHAKVSVGWKLTTSRF